MRRSAPLAVIHLVGNAPILWLGYYWLGISESDGAHLAWSAVVLLLFVILTLSLHGTALAMFDRESRPGLSAAIQRVSAHLVPVFVLAMLAVVVYWILALLYGKFAHSAFVIASFLTLHLRKPVSPTRVLAWYHAFIRLLRWVAAPALLLPLAASVVREGWRGYHFVWLRRSTKPLYWLEVCLLMLLAIWAPLRLLHWVPDIRPFSGQMASFVGRLVLGYLLFVSSLLLLEFFTSAGKPRPTQASTVGSP